MDQVITNVARVSLAQSLTDETITGALEIAKVVNAKAKEERAAREAAREEERKRLQLLKEEEERKLKEEQAAAAAAAAAAEAGTGETSAEGE